MSVASEPVTICVAPSGAYRSKADHPALPLAAAELAEEAVRCRAAGASALHLHVRDAQGRHSLDAGRYREAIEAIRERVGEALVLQITTEAAGRFSAAQQRATIEAVRPQAASVALREMLPDAAELPQASRFYAWAHEAGVAVQHILYAPREVQRLTEHVAAGHIPGPAAALFVLGRRDAPLLEPRELLAWLQGWPAGWPWSVCGFGRREPQLLAAAIGLGGHARVGLENNLLRPDGQHTTGNAENVANCAEMARRAGRPLAQAAEALAVLGGRLRPAPHP